MTKRKSRKRNQVQEKAQDFQRSQREKKIKMRIMQILLASITSIVVRRD